MVVILAGVIFLLIGIVVGLTIDTSKWDEPALKPKKKPPTLKP